jgi:hypothetical protein
MPKFLYLFSIFLLEGSLFAAEPFAGTWTLSIAKSKFGESDKPPRQLVMVIQEQGDQDVVTVNGVAADGSPISTKYTVLKTGGEEKFSEGGPSAGTSVVLAKRRVDSRTADFRRSQNGRVIQTVHTVLSADGKTMTQTVKGTDSQAKSYESVEVADRQ